ncbi:hypothetical protein HQ563_14970, partial [bacterium]|nr:hypothetical protein [bacterium]
SSLFAAEPKSARKPVVHVVFVRPKTSDPEREGERPVISWPGYQFDIKTGEALHKKVLTEAAEKLGVELVIKHEPLGSDEAVNAYLEQLKKAPPDGLFIVAMELFRWGWVNHLAQNRGDIPTIIYSPMGSSFTDMLKPARALPKTFVGATQDIHWPAFGLRMLNTVWRMKNTRLCILAGNKTSDTMLDVIGTTLHYIPLARFNEEFKKVEASDEVRAMADYYTNNAKKIIEPKKEEILDAAKNYFVCRRLMTAENCHGISIDCLRESSIYHRPPCMAFSHFLDHGIVAACEADWNAAISMQLTHYLFERPGFMQDPAPNTINNTLMGAHCMSATKLDGFDKPTRAPYILRSYHTRTGVALQVLWRIGQKVTIMKFQGPESIILGTGRVVANIAQPPAGCCRTAVEIALDGVPDSGDTKGFHQLFIYGDLERPFKAYCKLAGIKVVHI